MINTDSEKSDMIEWVESDEFKRWSKDWWSDYSKQEKEKQKKIDNDPNAQTLYSYEIDVNTLEIIADEIKVLYYDEDVTGFASYEESEQSCRVYAESLISSDEARQIVYKFLSKFKRCYDEIAHILREESVAGCDCRKRGQICDCYQLSYR